MEQTENAYHDPAIHMYASLLNWCADLVLLFINVTSQPDTIKSSEKQLDGLKYNILLTKTQ